MTSPVMDRGRFPPTLWRAMRSAGLEPPKVLRAAGLPSTLHLDAAAALSTAQLFAIWKALEALTDDPVVALTYLLGYQDTTSFYRAFKDWAGVSPGEWRSGIETESQTSGAMH